MKFCSLFSGSSGNAVFVREKQTGILIDAGKNGKQLEKNLLEVGEEASQLKAIFITHEHIDHIQGAGVLSRRYQIPVYAKQKTWDAIGDKIGKFKDSLRCVLPEEGSVNLGDIKIQPFQTSHDAADPVGYAITNDKKKICIMTDTGIVTPQAKIHLPGSELVYLESNHDIGMLEAGSYPYYLKQRVKSSLGHLSNDLAAQTALDLVQSGAKTIVLAHLSSENNVPMLAYQTSMCKLKEAGIVAERDMILEVAPRNIPCTVHKV